jgi:hypothetical protein
MRELLRRVEQLESQITVSCSCGPALVICDDESEIPPQANCPSHHSRPRLIIIEGMEQPA